MTTTNCSLAKLDYPDYKAIVKLTIADPRDSSTFTSLANKILTLECVKNSSDCCSCASCMRNLSILNPLTK